MPESKNTVAQSVVTGSVAGAVEVMVNHPLWSVKTRLQSGEPFTMNPYVLYRGILPNAASMVPITALQVGANRYIQQSFFTNTEELSNTQKILSAFIAGWGSSLVSCPTERVMTWQGKTGYTFQKTAQYLMSEGGTRSLFTGFTATGWRDGLFTAFYLGVTPALKTSVQPLCSNEHVASLTSGTAAGLVATLASQGFDTVKAAQQSSNPAILVSFREAVKKVTKERGVRGLFKGIVPRGVRVISALNVMSWTIDKMETTFRNHDSRSKSKKT